MKLLYLFFIFVNIFYGAFSQDIDEDAVKAMNAVDKKWIDWKASHNKDYAAEFWDSRRKKLWEDNCDLIDRHNAEAAEGLHSYTLRLNNMADLSLKEYTRRMLKLTKTRQNDPGSEERVGATHFDRDDVPAEIDWREKGFVTPPYNQRSCGSCYAFSIAHSIQGQVFKRTGNLINLSEQQIVDCSIRMGNKGCAGGSLRNTLRYLERSGGLMKESDYPYTATQNRCQFVEDLSVINITSWAILPARDEYTMEGCVATIGPLAVSINASPHTFQLYNDGVYDDPGCSSNFVNHAMLVVGYTQDYWILKNWWGQKWGQDGYMKLKRNSNRCGVANYAAYSIA